jgi:uncharacterized coiled-coil DUF342 family protein
MLSHAENLAKRLGEQQALVSKLMEENERLKRAPVSPIAQSKIEEMAVKADNANRELDRVKKEMQELQNRYNAQKKLLSEMKEQQETSHRTNVVLERQLEETKSRLSSATKDDEIAHKQAAALKADLATATSNLDAERKKAERLQRELTDAKGDVLMSAKEIGELKNKLVVATAEIEKLRRARAEADTFKEENVALRNQIKACERRIAEVEKEKETLAKRAASVSSKADSVDAQVSELQKQLEEAENRIKELKDAHQSELAEAIKLYDAARDENGRLRNLVPPSESEVLQNAPEVEPISPVLIIGGDSGDTDNSRPPEPATPSPQEMLPPTPVPSPIVPNQPRDEFSDITDIYKDMGVTIQHEWDRIKSGKGSKSNPSLDEIKRWIVNRRKLNAVLKSKKQSKELDDLKRRERVLSMDRGCPVCGQNESLIRSAGHRQPKFRFCFERKQYLCNACSATKNKILAFKPTADPKKRADVLNPDNWRYKTAVAEEAISHVSDAEYRKLPRTKERLEASRKWHQSHRNTSQDNPAIVDIDGKDVPVRRGKGAPPPPAEIINISDDEEEEEEDEPENDESEQEDDEDDDEDQDDVEEDDDDDEDYD